MLAYKLRKPFDNNGKTITELNVDFDDVPAELLISAYEEHAVRKSTSPGYGDQMLPLLLVAKTNGMIVEDLRSKLKGGDYLRVIKRVETFFDSVDSGANGDSASSITPAPTS
jgi:hypothetical protein